MKSILSLIVLISVLSNTLNAQFDYLDPDIVPATMILEAGGELHSDAMLAVYEVIRNRAKRSGRTMIQECMRRKQFSCWNNHAKRAELLRLAKRHKKFRRAKLITELHYNPHGERHNNVYYHSDIHRRAPSYDLQRARLALERCSPKPVKCKTINNSSYIKYERKIRPNGDNRILIYKSGKEGLGKSERITTSDTEYSSGFFQKTSKGFKRTRRPSNITHGATHYHAKRINPYWAPSLSRTCTIGNHVFYKRK